MIDDMKFRNMSSSTQKVYTHAVANFSVFHGRSPANSESKMFIGYRAT